MDQTTNNQAVFRLIDANLNRLREGVRVVEEIVRFCYNNKALALQLKKLRHKTVILETLSFLESRNTQSDVLTTTTLPTESNRSSWQDIITANFKRSQESARTLEESFKLLNLSHSERFKSIRYELYILEQQVQGIINDINHHPQQ